MAGILPYYPPITLVLIVAQMAAGLGVGVGGGAVGGGGTQVCP